MIRLNATLLRRLNVTLLRCVNATSEHSVVFTSRERCVERYVVRTLRHRSRFCGSLEDRSSVCMVSKYVSNYVSKYVTKVGTQDKYINKTVGKLT